MAVSRTLPDTVNSTVVMVSLLNVELAGKGIVIHAAELPAGWSPQSAVLIVGSGGDAGINVPELTEMFITHSYGTTPVTGRVVDQEVFNALHRFIGKKVTIGATVVYVPLIERIAGPFWNREMVTEWSRWTSTYRVTMSEWAVAA